MHIWLHIYNISVCMAVHQYPRSHSLELHCSFGPVQIGTSLFPWWETWLLWTSPSLWSQSLDPATLLPLPAPHACELTPARGCPPPVIILIWPFLVPFWEGTKEGREKERGGRKEKTLEEKMEIQKTLLGKLSTSRNCWFIHWNKSVI